MTITKVTAENINDIITEKLENIYYNTYIGDEIENLNYRQAKERLTKKYSSETDEDKKKKLLQQLDNLSEKYYNPVATSVFSKLSPQDKKIIRIKTIQEVRKLKREYFIRKVKTFFYKILNSLL